MKRHRHPRRRASHLGGWLPLGVVFLLLGLLLPFLRPLRPQPPQPSPPLPSGLPPLRQAMVTHAASLTGRVGYFWGGKSLALGWDPRWGVSTVVSAEGSDTTGALLPFGLDCSGYVTWCAVNAAGTAQALDGIGNGVRAQYAGCTPVPWTEVQPGDLLFFPDLSHVGIALDFTPEGALAALHCSKSLGGVVRSSDAAATGFTLAGRPALYQEDG